MAKEEKSISQSKPNVFVRVGTRVRNYIQETIAELRKVNWPTRREAWYLTVIVLIVTGIMSILLGGFDWLFSQFFEWLLTLPVS